MSNEFGQLSKTSRGCELIEFYDDQNHACSLQQSSAVRLIGNASEKPGAWFLLIGTDGARMHLDRKQVAGLVARLNQWLETGSFEKTK